MIEKAAIISTGDELITGRVVDTNSSRIAGQLTALGLRVAAILKVGDHRERLHWALGSAIEMADVVIGTGGLGPTTDDLTTEAVAKYLGRALKTDEAVAQSLRRRFESRGLPWTENNLKQAQFPEGAEIVPNPLGTAPGFRLALADGKTLFWLSGVPKEMEAMLKRSILPWIGQERRGGERIQGCTFKICGLTESKLDDILKPIALTEKATLSFRAHDPELTVCLTVKGDDQSQELFQRLRAQIVELIGPWIYGEDEETLEEIVGKLLVKTGLTLALAESCTGGYLSHRITRVAGSSAYFKSAAVTYSDEAKMRFLDVREDTLARHGAVSEKTAREMAKGIKERAQASIGLSVTGIAGPTGGGPSQPVGTVWIGLAQANQEEARHFRFSGDRERIILSASQAALNWLRTTLLNKQD